MNIHFNRQMLLSGHNMGHNGFEDTISYQDVTTELEPISSANSIKSEKILSALLCVRKKSLILVAPGQLNSFISSVVSNSKDRSDLTPILDATVLLMLV